MVRDEYPHLGRVDLSRDEHLDVCAQRKVFEKTEVHLAAHSPYLEQVQTVGSAHRDPRGWSNTVLYLALIN